MNIKSGNFRWELLLYAGVWGMVFLYPFLASGENVMDGNGFQWTEIMRLWVKILPFFVLFLLHVFLLLPVLLLKGHTRSYILAVAVLVGMFFAYEYSAHPFDRRPPSSHDRHVPERMEPPPGPGPEKHFRPEQGKIPGPVLIDTTIAVLMLICSLSVKMMFNYFQLRKTAEELERYRIQQELLYLKTQISPHFFMNMLNNIHGMVELDKAKAQDMILEMANLMRYVLYESSAPTVALPREVAFINSYISLMRERYSPKKVAISFDMSGEQVTEGMFIPPLIFIVFIENAFKHGISYREHSYIDISLETSGGRLTFRCANSNHKSGKLPDKYGGMGLKNVRKRLEMLYNEDFTLTIDDSETDFDVALNIPVYDHTLHNC